MGYIRSDIERCLTSKWFYISIIGIIAVYFLGDWGDLKYHSSNYDALTFISVSSAIGCLSELTILLSAIPFAMSFCEDLSHNYIKSSLIRGNILKYSISKIITCITSSILVVLIGKFLLIFALSFVIPLVNPNSLNYESFSSEVYGFLLVNKNYILYFFIMFLFGAILCSIFSLIGLIITTKLPNKFLAITSPIVIYFLLFQIGISSDIPGHLKVYNIMKGHLNLGGPINTLIYIIGVAMVSYIIGGYMFYKGVKKNVEQ
ncbi:MAG: hypothetical protein ACRCXA_08920 [Peptostreptococcaceae bacterium]